MNSNLYQPQFTQVNMRGGMVLKCVSFNPQTVPEGKTPDYIIPTAARISFDNFDVQKTRQQDKSLIHYLLKNYHTSPFEMATITFVAKIPKFVSIQLLRHRTFRFNEESQRYHEIKEGMFKPSSNYDLFVRSPHPTNKQSSVPVQMFKNPEQVKQKLEKVEQTLDELFQDYHELIEMGVAKECARFCLPMSTWTHIVFQVDMNNLMKFLTLRMDEHSQFEIRLLAGAMYLLTKQIFPDTMEAFEKFRMNPETMALDSSYFELS